MSSPPPIHPSARRWYTQFANCERTSAKYSRHYDKDGLPKYKPCDFCGELVHNAYLCDTCALCEVLRWEQYHSIDGTNLLTTAVLTNSTGVMDPHGGRKTPK